MDINKRNRSELKAYFVRKAVPTEGNFAELIDGTINQKEDGLVKEPGNPLSIQATGDDASPLKALDLYRGFSDPGPEWTLALQPRSNPLDAQTGKRGLGVCDSGGVPRLFIEHATGKVGLGTLEPQAQLHVAGNTRISGDLRVTGQVVVPNLTWQAAPLGAGWIWYGAPFQSPEYSKDALGIVRLRGMAKNTAAMAVGAVVATLPDGYRPPAQTIHVTIGNQVLNRVDINVNGQIILGVALAINLWISLDSISFAAVPPPAQP